MTYRATGSRLRRLFPSVAGLAVVTLLTAGLAPASAGTSRADYQDPSLPVQQRVDDLMSRMSLRDKIGQMVQIERDAAGPAEVADNRIGSVLSGGGSTPESNTPEAWADMYDRYQRAALDTRLGIPLLYGVDAVHGHNNLRGATVFPHNIGLGAADDPKLVQRIGAATAEEVAATGIDWTFSPCVCVARDDRWGRTYEAFGETPELPKKMTREITGYQGKQLGGDPTSIMATAKHYVGDGGTTGGQDQGNTQLSERELRKIHLKPFRKAVKRDVASVMVSYSSWNGAKMHAQKYLVQDVLKRELGFDGIVISDYDALHQLDGDDSTLTASEVRRSVNAGLDMIMLSSDHAKFLRLLRQEVEAGNIPMRRIDDATSRILTKKFEMGLFEHPFAQRDLLSTVGSDEHRALARQAVRESQTLLENDGVLPLSPEKDEVFVAGSNADDIGNQSGGWTISWQGSSGDITEGTTILEGIRQVSNSKVTYDEQGDGVDGSYDAAVAVVGEKPYAEYEGDRPNGVRISEQDLNTIAKLRSAGIPVAVVTVSGRPVDVSEHVDDWNALLASWLPGTQGGGVADVLFGKHNPTGKLPVSWMRSYDQQPINKGDGKDPLYPYGYGLSYRS
ncbi:MULTISPECIES: glycoside hydrolase family 3 N-terminal domain-containing protein [unclassified Actinopolyspora]|uniref:glycoside hydrolase family 3 protein n=1 Tax=unclassified Actinopolyspora TaxID=2639451 RepID=UPI001A980F6B|nr:MULTISPECIES: glycoside hydrolase family 3 N-terminal domain-containing protein [unclassified Actinopolyspora]